MDQELRGLVRLVAQALGYAAIYGAAFAGVRGGCRLAIAARPEQVRAAARWLAVRPGRCMLAGVASFLAGWAVLGIGQAAGPLTVFVVGWIWGRAGLAGLAAWLYQRGRELQAFESIDAATDADALERGTWAAGAAFLPPFLGWAAFFLALLAGLGAEALRWWTGGEPPVTPPPAA